MDERDAMRLKAEVQTAVVDFIAMAKNDIETNVSLQLRAFRSETRWWIIFAVVANQTLSHFAVPNILGYAAFVAVGAKAIAVALTSR